MKNSLSTSLKALLAIALSIAFSPYAAGTSFEADGKPLTVGKVIEFLGKLLSKSQVEGEDEATIFAKFKCYCDDNEKSKKLEIKDGTEGISKLGSEIEGLQASNGELSTQCAKLKADIADNLDAQNQAKSLRSNAAKDFKAEKADLTKAVTQMSQAIQMLSEVGADQTLGSGADHDRFMAGHKTFIQRNKKSSSFLGLGADVQHALKAASELLSPEKRSQLQSLVQAPFTGSYASQSASILGILKNMRDTFKSNLQSSSETEETDTKAHAKLMKTLEGTEKEMSTAYADKQQELGENDAELGAKKLQLKAATESKEAAEEFLSKLMPVCETKTKEYNARKQLRATEEASIAEAKKILSTDSAFKSFAQTANDSFFLQLRSDRRGATIRLQVKKLFEQAALSGSRMSRLADLLQANNPFSVIFTEIKKMEELIAKEQDSDQEKHDLCKKQTDGGKDKLKETNDEIDNTEEALGKLEESVDKPQTGLKAQEVALEQAMEDNVENQKKETTMRQNENVQYQKNVAELVKAETLLKKAIGVLEKFYESLNEKSGVAAAALLQDAADPAPPPTWSGSYSGQSGDAKGETGAIGMLKFILGETQKSNALAHEDERDAQHDFEDNMAELTSEELKQQKNMVELKSALANAEKEMLDKKQELKQANKDKTATEAFLADIKPACDFIFDNFELRTKNRKLETSAMVQARKLLKSSPAYQTASAEAEADALGACKSKCGVPEHVKCKACLADVSVPGYCAGHKGTTGC